MPRALQVPGLVTILAVFGVATAGAQVFGRIELTVLDAAGEAVPDVDVTVTCDDMRNFYKELKTNRKGKAIITLVDATKRYNFHLVHPEHGEIKQILEPAMRQTKRVELAFTDTDRPGGVVGDHKVLEGLTASGNSADPALLYNEALASLRVGDDATAEARLLEALGIDSEMKPAIKALAVVYGRRADWQKTALTADRFMALDSSDGLILRLRWEAYRALGDSAKEAEARRALASIDPLPIAQDLYERGAELFNSGQTDGAIAELQSALEFHPEHARAHYQLAICYVGVAKNEEAKEHFRKFLELAPDDSEASSARDMLSYLE